MTHEGGRSVLLTSLAPAWFAAACKAQSISTRISSWLASLVVQLVLAHAMKSW